MASRSQGTCKKREASSPPQVNIWDQAAPLTVEAMRILRDATAKLRDEPANKKQVVQLCDAQDLHKLRDELCFAFNELWQQVEVELSERCDGISCARRVAEEAGASTKDLVNRVLALALQVGTCAKQQARWTRSSVSTCLLWLRGSCLRRLSDTN